MSSGRVFPFPQSSPLARIKKALAPSADLEMCKASRLPILGHFSLLLGALGLRPTWTYYFETKDISQKTQAWCHWRIYFISSPRSSAPWRPIPAAVLPPGVTAKGERLLCLAFFLKHVGKTTCRDPKGYFALVDFYHYKCTFFHGIVLALGQVP